MSKKEHKDLFSKIKQKIGINLSLIIVVMTAIVLEGGGLMQYLYLRRDSSDPRSLPIFLMLLVLGLILVVALILRAVHNMKTIHKISTSNERMENELYIARGIQMAMLPKTFPPYPDRSDVDMYASIIPAKEVGGDLYDFFIKDERLYFCIGDVSGKGVPASLVMAVTRSLFRTIASHETSPAKIVGSINESMSELNESTMFVTMFLGCLDLANGYVRYCNAGHNAPIIISGGNPVFLPVNPNIPIGIDRNFVFKEQDFKIRNTDTLFMYTDGITEAENEKDVLYGEDRLMAAIQPAAASCAKDLMGAVEKSISDFVGDADQSDDKTVLIIRYTNPIPAEDFERHLILHNDIQQIPQLAPFVELVADEARLDQSLSMSLNLALEEAVSNVIMYAYPAGADGLVDIEVIIRSNELEFIVTDNGKPFDPTAAADPDISLEADERSVGGLGIFLVRNIMDSVSYERTEGNNILRMIKKI